LTKRKIHFVIPTFPAKNRSIQRFLYAYRDNIFVGTTGFVEHRILVAATLQRM